MADNQKFVQAQPFQLYGAGCSAGDTSITLTSFKKLDGTNILMTDLGSKGFMTLEPGTTGLEEAITFTGVTQNVNGTATLTGVSNQMTEAPYTETSGVRFTHVGAVTAVLSNTAGFYDRLVSKDDDETINGSWTFEQSPIVPTPTNPTDAVSKGYADSLAIAGGVDASSSAKGIAKLSVDPASPTNPIAVGDNDPRVASITASTVAALAGTSGIPSSINKFVTNDDTGTSGNNKILRLDSSGKLPAIDISQGTGLTVAYNVGFGSWATATADGNGHQVATDGFLVGYIQATNTANSTIIVKTDSASTPTTIRWQASGYTTNNPVYGSFMCPIKKSDYYSIAISGGSANITAFFIPIS